MKRRERECGDKLCMLCKGTGKALESTPKDKDDAQREPRHETVDARPPARALANQQRPGRTRLEQRKTERGAPPATDKGPP